MLQATILIVDDDNDVRKLLSDTLTKNNYKAITVGSVNEAQEQINLQKPNLMLLDINLPIENGIDFCRRIHSQHPIPTIMLTASDDDIDRVLAYEVGADHYITKPFNPKVLLATIKAVLRRTTKNSNSMEHQEFHNANYIYFNNWCFDLRERTLINDHGVSVELTTKEFELLHLLVENDGQTLSRNDLIQSLYGREYNGYDRNIDIMIMRIRKKLETDPQNPKIIKTIHGKGYLFNAPIQCSDTNHTISF
ncbi:response regulator transcription factor [Fastidiosibacter lacustris]|uniref:response regulator transcription factor n=1 Tax=Fastidiosibacter lacustris TaxID=2056695 RepID=UPI000E357927|nr:response regulator transcription factor [Fastidiosibacter lacustris]